MANTAIQNIKILHKRYSTEQWTNGVSVNGKTIIPVLAQGEIGLDTTTYEVRIGTNSAAEQTWAQAHVIDAEVTKSATYFHKSGETGNAPNEGETYVVTNCDITNTTEGKHSLTLVFKNIELVAPTPDIPDLIVTDGTATTSDGEIAVVTSLSKGTGDDHEIITTKGTAATKSYVDGRKLTATKEGTGAFITGIKEVTNTDGNHSVVFETGDVEIVIPEITVDSSATGDFVTGVSVDANDDHKLILTKGTLPTLTGGSAATEDATIVGGVTVADHTITAEKKTISSGDSVIKVAGTKTGIVITADTYTKAEIDQAHNELAKAMRFAGTLEVGETLPAASAENKGEVWKVAEAGTYNGQAAKVGDLFISDGTTWRFVPSGDETFTDTWRPISVNGTQVKSESISGGAVDFVGGNAISVSHENGKITVAHNDTSAVEDLDKTARTYVDGLTFDEYGHVTGYTVGTEVDQFIPKASGSKTAGNLEILSGVSLGEDGTGNHVLTGTTKSLSGDGKLVDVVEADGKITVSHKTVTTDATTATATTITAGSDNKTFTVVDSISNDGYGHITDVKTKSVTVEIPEYVDTDTTYEIAAATDSTTVGSTSAKINLTAGGSGSGTDSVAIKVDSATATPADGLQVNVSGDTITLSGKATAELLGLIRAAYNLTESASTTVTDSYLKNYSGNHNDRLYGLNVRKDGKAFVEVPWVDTHVIGTKENAPTTVDMYAFSTDEYGHVNAAYAVTTIDGNYA